MEDDLGNEIGLSTQDNWQVVWDEAWRLAQSQSNTRDDLLFNAHYSQVIITNEAERNYCISWCKAQGFDVDYLESINTYPFAFLPKDGRWNRSFKISEQFSFSEFVRILEKIK